MKRSAYRGNEPVRKIENTSGQPIGFLRGLRDQMGLLKKDMTGIKLRLEKTLSNAEPGSAVGSHVFKPDLNSSITFDYLMDGVAGTRVVSNYVLRDAVTYDIPIVMPPPGVLLVRSMKVRLYQRLYVPGCGPMQVPMNNGDFFLRTNEVYQTKKFSFPDNGSTQTANARAGVRAYARRCSYFWNLIDTKSGFQYADDLVPDQILLPQGIGIPAVNVTEADGGPSGMPQCVTGHYLQFRRPWLFERDGQLSFLFRPIMPVIQPAASSSYAPYPFEDRELGNTVRDSSVTVRIDLHGERYRDVRDAMNMGAVSR